MQANEYHPLTAQRMTLIFCARLLLGQIRSGGTYHANFLWVFPQQVCICYLQIRMGFQHNRGVQLLNKRFCRFFQDIQVFL